MTHSFFLPRTLLAFLLSVLALALLTAPRSASAATVTISGFNIVYSASRANDTVPVNCFCTYTTPSLTGHWILYEVITGTGYDGTTTTRISVLASGDYASGQTISQTQYPNGAYYAVQNGGGPAHCSYHYELSNEVWNPSTLVAEAYKRMSSPENVVF